MLPCNQALKPPASSKGAYSTNSSGVSSVVDLGWSDGDHQARKHCVFPSKPSTAPSPSISPMIRRSGAFPPVDPATHYPWNCRFIPHHPRALSGFPPSPSDPIQLLPRVLGTILKPPSFRALIFGTKRAPESMSAIRSERAHPTANVSRICARFNLLSIAPWPTVRGFPIVDLSEYPTVQICSSIVDCSRVSHLATSPPRILVVRPHVSLHIFVSKVILHGFFHADCPRCISTSQTICRRTLTINLRVFAPRHFTWPPSSYPSCPPPPCMFPHLVLFLQHF